MLRLYRQQQLLLGGDQFRTVDREEGFAFIYVLVGEVNVDGLHPSTEARVNVRNASLIFHDQPHRADCPGQRFVFCAASCYANQLLLLGAELDRRVLWRLSRHG